MHLVRVVAVVLEPESREVKDVQDLLKAAGVSRYAHNWAVSQGRQFELTELFAEFLSTCPEWVFAVPQSVYLNALEDALNAKELRRRKKEGIRFKYEMDTGVTVLFDNGNATVV